MGFGSVKTQRDALSRRERQRLATRDRLFDAALETFREVGFTRAQIDRIVERAGVARGTFYFHFPTKEHVLTELQRRLEARIVERLGAPMRHPPESVHAFLLQVVDAIGAEARSLGDPALVRELIAMYVREPRVLDLSGDPLVVALLDYFSEAAERGDVRDDITPEEVTGIFLTILFGSVAGAVESLEDHLPEFVRAIDVFAKGIAP